MNTLLNTEMMNFFNRIDVGTIKTGAQFTTAIHDICDDYGTEATGAAYLALLKQCSPSAQEKISRLAGR